MIFINTPENLPTLVETVEILKKAVLRLPIRHLMLYDTWRNDGKQFQLNRTQQRYAIKPNIFQQPCLFAGLTEFSNSLIPEYYRRDDFLIMNLLREEFMLVMESHPLYRLLKDGINVPNSKRPIQIENPYGLALSYGFPTPFIPLTSSIEIAAFHACHKYNVLTGRIEPVNDGTGIIYIFDLNVPMPLIPGLTTVGKQAFKRPGANKLFAYLMGQNANFNKLPFVNGFQFRHNEESTRCFNNIFKGGMKLYPNERISEKVRNLLINKTVSEEAFKRNLAENPKDYSTRNKQKIQEAGYKITKTPAFLFTRQELKEDWFSRSKGLWEELWSDVSLVLFNDKKSEYILSLPDNDQYAKYFFENP